MLKVYGSRECPDCVELKERFDERGVAYEFHDVTASLADLKAFLKIRDSYPIFEKVRERGAVGIPTILKEDGAVVIGWERYFKEQGWEAPQEAAPAEGAACKVDGTGC